MGLDHLHVLQDQWTAVLLCVGAVVHLTLAQGVAGDLQLLVANILFSHHGRSGKTDLFEAFVVDIVKGDQLGPGVVVVRNCGVRICFRGEPGGFIYVFPVGNVCTYP